MMAVRDIYNPYLNLVVVSASVHDLLTASDGDSKYIQKISIKQQLSSRNISDSENI